MTRHWQKWIMNILCQDPLFVFLSHFTKHGTPPTFIFVFYRNSFGRRYSSSSMWRLILTITHLIKSSPYRYLENFFIHSQPQLTIRHILLWLWLLTIMKILNSPFQFCYDVVRVFDNAVDVGSFHWVCLQHGQNQVLHILKNTSRNIEMCHLHFSRFTNQIIQVIYFVVRAIFWKHNIRTHHGQSYAVATFVNGVKRRFKIAQRVENTTERLKQISLCLSLIGKPAQVELFKRIHEISQIESYPNIRPLIYHTITIDIE